MHRERAAAALRRRGDLVPVGGEHARGGRVHIREDCALNAAREDADARAARARRGRHGRDLGSRSPARRQLDERHEAPGQRSEAPERRQPERRPHAAGVGEDLEEQPPEQAVAPFALVLPLDGRAGRLDQPVVADAGRA
jgi:hypothetical protein